MKEIEKIFNAIMHYPKKTDYKDFLINILIKRIRMVIELTFIMRIYTLFVEINDVSMVKFIVFKQIIACHF